MIKFLYGLRCLYSALTPSQATDFHLLIGDWGHFIDMQFYMNFTLLLGFIFSIVSQIIHFYEYHCCRGQPYMNVFNMMSGQITPHSIGLTDENTIKDILKKNKNVLQIYRFIAGFNPLCSFHYLNFIISNQGFFTQHHMLWFISFINIFPCWTLYV